MAGGECDIKRAALPFIKKEVQVEGADSEDKDALVTFTVDLTSFHEDTPEIESSAITHRALGASQQKKVRKSETVTYLEDQEEEEEQGCHSLEPKKFPDFSLTFH